MPASELIYDRPPAERRPKSTRYLDSRAQDLTAKMRDALVDDMSNGVGGVDEVEGLLARMPFGLSIPNAAALIAVKMDAAIHIVVGSGGGPDVVDKGPVKDMFDAVGRADLDSRK